MPDTAFSSLSERAAYDGAAEVATLKSGEAAPQRMSLDSIVSGVDLSTVVAYLPVWAAGARAQGTLTIYQGHAYLTTSALGAVDGAINPADSPHWKRLDNQYHDGGAWSATGTYSGHAIVWHDGQKATYVARKAVPAGKEPNVASDWAEYWYRLGWANGDPGSFTGVSISGSTLRLTKRSGQHEDTALPSGGTEVAANPAGTDGDPLTRIAIGGTNYVVDAEVPVGAAQVMGRVTSTAGKNPADLAASTDPLKVPNPVSQFEDPTVASNLARIEASEDWPIVPLLSVPAAGGFLSNLDTAENSVEIAEGLYIIGTLISNIWVDRVQYPTRLSSGTPATSQVHADSSQRISIELLIERKSGADWVELAESFSPYTRTAPHNANNTGTVLANTPGSSNYNGDKSPVQVILYTVVAIPPGGAEIRFRLERGRSFAQNELGSAGLDLETGRSALGAGGAKGETPWGYYSDVPMLSFFPLGRPTQTAAPVIRPHISLFTVTGDIDPPAGSIAGDIYRFAYALTQGSHAGAARIIGFKGTTKPAGSATVLATLTDLDHGQGSLTIPNGVTLAADEEYRLRLQVFEEGIVPDVDTVPASYQDAVIVAHAPASAAVHWGYEAYDADQRGSADIARRIDFTNDLVTGSVLASSYSVQLPADSNSYHMYLAVKSDLTQPTGFTSGGQNATNSFYSAVTITISSVEYKLYILKPLFRLTSSNNGETFGVTTT